MAAGFAVHIKPGPDAPRPSVRGGRGDASGAAGSDGGAGDGTVSAAPRLPTLRPNVVAAGRLPDIRESEELDDEAAAVVLTPDVSPDSPNTASPGRWTRSKDDRRRRRRRKRSGASRQQRRPISKWVYVSACMASVAVGAVFFILMYAFRDHLGKWWKAL